LLRYKCYSPRSLARQRSPGYAGSTSYTPTNIRHSRWLLLRFLPWVASLLRLSKKLPAHDYLVQVRATYSAEALFNTKFAEPALKIVWKEEFIDVPVHRKTLKSVEGFRKSKEKPLTAASFDNNSVNLGRAAGLPDTLQSYVYRRGNLQVFSTVSLPCAFLETYSNLNVENYRQSVRDQGARLYYYQSTANEQSHFLGGKAYIQEECFNGRYLECLDSFFFNFLSFAAQLAVSILAWKYPVAASP
jgi:hypothetical protein